MTETTKELCTQCNKPIHDLVYALYSDKKEVGSKDPVIIGYLCQQCSSKLKIKPIRSVNGLKNLDQLIEKLIKE